MKFVYVATRGAADPTLASIPLHLAANGSLEVGHDTSVVLVGDAPEIVVGDTSETIQGVGVPPLSELIAKLKAHEVPVYV
jgi:predicted peroxiredoxin